MPLSGMPGPCWKMTRTQAGWAPVLAAIVLIATWLVLSRITWSHVGGGSSADSAAGAAAVDDTGGGGGGDGGGGSGSGDGSSPSGGASTTRQDSMLEWKRKQHAQITASDAWDMYKVGCYTFMASGEIELLTNHKTLRVLECKQRLPSALVIGVRGCDSFILTKVLGLHPMVISHSGSHFEWQSDSDNDDRNDVNLDIDSAVRRWRTKQPYSSRFQMTIEHSTDYGEEENNYLRGILSGEVMPGVKLVIMLRDPVVRFISEYARTTGIRNDVPASAGSSDKINNNKSNTTSPLHESAQPAVFQHSNATTMSNGSFTPYLHYDNQSSSSSSPSPSSTQRVENTLIEKYNTVVSDTSLIRSGIYVNVIKKIRSLVRDQDSLMVIDRNDFVRDPLKTFRELEGFLGLKPFFRSEHFEFDEDEGRYCMNVARRPDTHCVYEVSQRQLPAVDEELIRTLTQFYNKHDLELAALVGRNFSWMQR